MARIIDLTGQKFNRLLVVERVKTNKSKNSKWLCKCECGEYTTVLACHLKSGHTKSCGCAKIEAIKKANTKHGLRNTKLHSVWNSMKQRCLNENNIQYIDYGERGITICEEWKNDFELFYNWSISNGYEEGLSIDRINNDKGYYPDNCRWTNELVQANNTRSNHYLTFGSETKTIAEWGRELNLPAKIISDRITKQGWSIEKALTTPIQKRK
jgi:hypothetical protein